jgi:hypothetical protein
LKGRGLSGCPFRRPSLYLGIEGITHANESEPYRVTNESKKKKRALKAHISGTSKETKILYPNFKAKNRNENSDTIGIFLVKVCIY